MPGSPENKDGFDRIVLDHLFQRRERLFALRLAGHVRTAIRRQIADRGQFGVGMVLEVERQTELADAVADDPDPNLAVAEGLPFLGAVKVGLGLVKTGNGPGSLGGIEQGASGGSSGSGDGQERSPGNSCHVRILPTRFRNLERFRKLSAIGGRGWVLRLAFHTSRFDSLGLSSG